MPAALDEAERLAQLDANAGGGYWCIARKLGQRLRLAGIGNAGALARANRDYGQSEKLMQTVDEINRKLGRGTLRWAAEGLAQPWAARRGNVSPKYTTRWDQLLVVKAK